LSGKSIIGASLTLTFRKENVAWAPATVDVYPCLKQWDEPDWTYAEPFADPCVAWDIAGAQKPRKDRGGLISSTYMGDRYWYSMFNKKNYDDGEQFEFPLDAAMVQSWANDPCSNLGVILTMYLGAVTDVTFSSSEESVITERPKLTVTVGEGIVVPDVVGWLNLDAEAEIIERGLSIGNVTFAYSPVSIDYVISQDPCAGTVLLPPDTSVDLVVSLGLEMVVVPNVIELSHDDANMVLDGVGLVIDDVIEYERHATIPAGHVIDQDPNAGEDAIKGSAVKLTESLGPVLPDFNGDYIGNLSDFGRMASEWENCDPCAVTTDMTDDKCVNEDDLAYFVAGWLQYHCKNRPVADVSGNCCVDIADLAILLSEWLTCDEGNTANIDGDGDGCVNLPDLSVLSTQWGLCGEAYEP